MPREYLLLFVESDDDFIIVPDDSCLQCFRSKLDTEIINSWPIDQTEYKQLREFDVKGYHVTCQCKHS